MTARSTFRHLQRICVLCGGLVALLAGTTSPAQTPSASNAATAPAESVKTVAPGMEALVRARTLVEKFFEQSSNVICTESVTQAVLGPNNKANYSESSVFDYQMQTNSNTGSLKLVETRETRKASFRDSARTLLITNGFTGMLLIIHPQYETSYTFEPAGEEIIEGVKFTKINFKPVPGASSPAALQLRGQNYPLPLAGTIWIDPQSGAVTKLVAAMDASLSDVGLRGMRSEIHYSLISFREPNESYWMPVSAVIDVETPRKHWRNIHRFTGYKRFKATIQVENVESKQ